jgi:hypothetical protein
MEKRAVSAVASKHRSQLQEASDLRLALSRMWSPGKQLQACPPHRVLLLISAVPVVIQRRMEDEMISACGKHGAKNGAYRVQRQSQSESNQ